MKPAVSYPAFCISFPTHSLLRFLLLAALLALVSGYFRPGGADPSARAAPALDEQPSPTPEPGTTEGCISGSGWVPAYGPFRPEIAEQAAKELAAIGFSADVQASEYGERDSCGEYVPQAIDFVIRLSANTQPARLALQQIEPVLRNIAKPRLGTLHLIDANGETASMTDEPEPDLMPAAPPPAAHLLNRKVYIIAYDPIMSNGRRLHNYYPWFDPDYLTENVIDFWKNVSGNRMVYTVVGNLVLDAWPEHVDGHRYTEAEWLNAWINRTPHLPDELDYNRILEEFDICGKVNRGEIDELWLYGSPYNGGWESTLAGPGAYWYNSMPVPEPTGCNKLLPIMSFNFERDFDMALHNFGHRTESTMAHFYGSWEQNRTAHNWDRFALVKHQSSSYDYSGCGNIHFPPNGASDYDYTNTTPVQTNCADFENYPDLSAPSEVWQTVTCTTWGCDHNGFLAYWYGHFPANLGCAADGVGNDWWKYFATPALQALEQGWLTELWDNADMSGYPYTCWDVPQIEFNWGYDAPFPDLSADSFSNRWTRTLNFPAKMHTFHVIHDDGARLYVDNILRLDGWTTLGEETVDVNLSAGSHSLRLETNEITGAAYAGLWWEETNITGWRGEYYDNMTLSGYPVFVRDDGENIDFGNGNWNLYPLPSTDEFSVRWSRSVYFDGGEYRFTVFHDDGARLYIDGAPVIDNWCYGCVETDIELYTPEPGWRNVVLEMFDNYGGDGARLTWEHTVNYPFAKTQPADGAYSQPLTVNLAWRSAANATGYQVCYDITDNDACDTRWIDAGTALTTAISNLCPGMTYYWQVRANRPDGNIEPGSWWSFTTAAPGPAFRFWKGEYWNNASQSGSPLYCRDDFGLSFDWLLNAPADILPNDLFSARWTRAVTFPAGEYRFHMLHDDGARLFVDNSLEIDAWDADDCCFWKTADLSLAEGSHTIKMDLFENGGWSNAHLWWERLDITGWRGEYYNSADISGNPVLVRDDGPAISFNWGLNSPDPLVQANNFSVRWQKANYFDQSGDYHFQINHRNGARLIVDGVMRFENWCSNCSTSDVFTLDLDDGWHDIILEYFNQQGSAHIDFSWSFEPQKIYSFLPLMVR